MKKVIFIIALSIFTLSFSQTSVSLKSDREPLEKIYKDGQSKFNYDLGRNLLFTASSFNASGNFKLNFTIDESGKISDVELLPQLYEKSFEKEVKRDLMRLAKRFVGKSRQNISVDLNFSLENRISDGRDAFMGRENFMSNDHSICSTR